MTANPKLALDQKNLGKQGAFIDDNAHWDSPHTLLMERL